MLSPQNKFKQTQKGHQGLQADSNQDRPVKPPNQISENDSTNIRLAQGPSQSSKTTQPEDRLQTLKIETFPKNPTTSSQQVKQYKSRRLTWHESKQLKANLRNVNSRSSAT